MRAGKDMVLRPEAVVLHSQISQAFRALETAVLRLQEQAEGGAHQVLSLRVLPSFALRYLMPRFGDFYTHFPDIELKLVVCNRAANLVQECVDAGDLAMAPGSWPVLS